MDKAPLDGAIRAVFFDIGNVLLKFDSAEVARKMAWAVRRHPLRVARYLWHSDIGEAVERGSMPAREIYLLMRRELDYTGDYEDFRALWCDHFTLERPTAALLKRLTRSHRVYLLSNTNHLHYEFIRERYDFPHLVHGAVLSYKLGLRKPEPEIYLAALRRARVRPHEAVFIDDLEVNVAAAAKLGINALRYRGTEALKRDLGRLGILDG